MIKFILNLFRKKRFVDVDDKFKYVILHLKKD